MIWKSQRALWWAFRWIRSQESKGASNWTVSRWFRRAGRADFRVWRLPLADSNWPSHRQERRSPDLPVQLRRRNRRLKSLEKDKRMSIMASFALLFWIIALNQNHQIAVFILDFTRNVLNIESSYQKLQGQFWKELSLDSILCVHRTNELKGDCLLRMGAEGG